MRKKSAFFGAAFWAILACHSFVFAQISPDLRDPAYKNGVLEKIAVLVESKYVLADKAKGFADEFKAKCAAGAYNALTEPKEFAEKVTADLIAITRDKHLNFRVMVASDVGEKASGSLHHPVRYFRMRARENAGFYKLEWIEPRVGYIDLRRFYSFDQAKDQAADAALDSLFKIARRAGMISEFFNFVFAYNFQSPPDERMQLAILMKNIEFFPQSFTAYELLATVCESKGNKELALRYFLKVLELDPGNRNAVRKIQELQK